MQGGERVFEYIFVWRQDTKTTRLLIGEMMLNLKSKFRTTVLPVMVFWHWFNYRPSKPQVFPVNKTRMFLQKLPKSQQGKKSDSKNKGNERSKDLSTLLR